MPPPPVVHVPVEAGDHQPDVVEHLSRHRDRHLEHDVAAGAHDLGADLTILAASSQCRWAWPSPSGCTFVEAGLPKTAEPWSLTSLRDDQDSWLAIKTDGDVVAYFGKMDMGQRVDARSLR
jgi:hypothetical protein